MTEQPARYKLAIDPLLSPKGEVSTNAESADGLKAEVEKYLVALSSGAEITHTDGEYIYIKDPAGAVVMRLKERVEELEAENAALKQLLDFLQTAVHSAAGNLTAADAKIRQWKEKE